jgi:hypothetical protein
MHFENLEEQMLKMNEKELLEFLFERILVKGK